jgi:hypothetical protein
MAIIRVLAKAPALAADGSDEGTSSKELSGVKTGMSLAGPMADERHVCN